MLLSRSLSAASASIENNRFSNDEAFETSQYFSLSPTPDVFLSWRITSLCFTLSAIASWQIACKKIKEFFFLLYVRYIHTCMYTNTLATQHFFIISTYCRNNILAILFVSIFSPWTWSVCFRFIHQMCVYKS
jgi:hypothetical protein